MIKKIFLLLCLSGCAVDLAYIEVFREGLKKNQINDLQPFLDTNLSFVKATKGKNQAIFILSDYNEGVEIWVGADNERISTYKGVITRTSKLDHDMTVHNIEALQKNIFQDNIQLLASLSNPSVSYLNLGLTLIRLLLMTLTVLENINTICLYQQLILIVNYYVFLMLGNLEHLSKVKPR